MTVISSPMSKFPMEDISVLWNFQHGRCDLTGTVIRDMASPNGWTGPLEMTAVNGATFSHDINGAKGITFDGSNDYYTFDGGDTRFGGGVGAGANCTDMYWVNLNSWKNMNIVQWGSDSQRWTQWTMNSSFNPTFNYGFGFGKQNTNDWIVMRSSNDGITFGGSPHGPASSVPADIINKWWCIAVTNPYPDVVRPFIMGEPATDVIYRLTGVVNSIAKDSTAKIGWGGDDYIDGAIGFFASWNRTLSDAELKLAFDATKGYFGVQR